MESSNKRFADQLHAAMSIMESNETVEETVEETTSNPTDELVIEYLSSFFGQDLPESTAAISDEDLLEALESLNALCGMVNEATARRALSSKSPGTYNLTSTKCLHCKKPFTMNW